MKYLTRSGKTKAIALLAMSLMVALPTQAASWKTPVLLSSNNTADSPMDINRADSAIDNNGNVVAVWVENADSMGKGQIWTKTRINGVWSTATTLDLAVDSINPVVKMSASGNATAVWSNASGIWSANKLMGQAWSTPTLLVAQPTGGIFARSFSMNSKGDALLTWQENTLGIKVYAIKRPVNQTWSAPMTVALSTQPFVILQGGNGVDLITSTIGENGDALTAWVSYNIHPHGYKNTGNLQVSRLTKAGTVWQASSVIGTIPPNYSTFNDAYQKTSLLLDAQGRAGILFSDRVSWFISKQIAANKNWSNVSTLALDSTDTTCATLTSAPVGTYTYCNKDSGMSGSAYNDSNGNITFAFSDNYAYQVGVDGSFNVLTKYKTTLGSLTSTTWSKPTTVAIPTGIFPPPYKLDVGANGSAVFAWSKTNPTTLSPMATAVMRTQPTGSWQSSVSYDFNSPNNTSKVLGVDVNAVGKSSALYQVYDGVNYLTYITSYD